jgi:drug/metabolite transporter (DMT)-like permease
MTSRRDHRLGLIYITISAIAWSTAGFFTRLISLDAFTLLTWRGIFGSLSLLVVIIALNPKGWMSEFRRIGKPGLIYIALTVVGMTMFITSLTQTSVAHSAVIYATIPFISAFLGWIYLGEVPGVGPLVASLVAISGVLLMVGTGTDGHLSGDLLSLGMTFCMGCSIILVRKYPDMPTAPAACIGALVSVFVCAPFGHPLSVSAIQLSELVLFGAVNSAIGLAFFALGSRHLPAIETALIGALDTPLAPLWVWLFFQETPGKNTIIGGVIVFIAVVGHIWVGNRGKLTAIAAE